MEGTSTLYLDRFIHKEHTIVVRHRHLRFREPRVELPRFNQMKCQREEFQQRRFNVVRCRVATLPTAVATDAERIMY
jgi:hypothetical protein